MFIEDGKFYFIKDELFELNYFKFSQLLPFLNLFRLLISYDIIFMQ